MDHTFAMITQSAWSSLITSPSLDTSESSSQSHTISSGPFVPSQQQPPMPAPDLGVVINTFNHPIVSTIHSPNKYINPPSLKQAKLAFYDLTNIIQPPRKSGKGRGHFVGGDKQQTQLEQMRVFLGYYCCQDQAEKQMGWKMASRKAAHAFRRGDDRARTLRKWAQAFITDRSNLPEAPSPVGKPSLLKNENLKKELIIHLREVGQYVQAMDIVDFTAQLTIQTKFNLLRPISLSSAQDWMKELGYCWTKEPTGQFADGHERLDVVDYRRNVFLPRMAELDRNTRIWNDHGVEEINGDEPHPRNRRTVFWFHDESIFYANDQRKVYWVHKSDRPKLRPNGEGASIMVADFISTDYGWLRSRDGKESAQILFRPGKNHEGYFTHQHVLNHITVAIDIVERDHPFDKHVFFLDNATTHNSLTPTSLSARHMTKNPTQAGHKPFAVEVPIQDQDGKMVYRADGQPLKKKVQMDDGQFADGTSQPLYFPPGHPLAGAFKGMTTILEERGFRDAKKLRAECKGFKCPPWNPSVPCCCRRLLFNQPDFCAVEPEIVTYCRERGHEVVYLPKFHCELNCIEQCWGYAKRVYREFLPSPREADL